MSKVESRCLILSDDGASLNFLMKPIVFCHMTILYHAFCVLIFARYVHVVFCTRCCIY